MFYNWNYEKWYFSREKEEDYASFERGETAEEKREREMRAFAQRCSLETLNQRDLALVKRVANDLADNGGWHYLLQKMKSKQRIY